MKRVIKYLLFFLGSLILLVSILITIFWWKYSSVVGSIPHNEYVKVKPGKYGQYVNTFIGTGGFPAWVCGQNFPGATVPFGMVRLSPETASIFFDIKGLNNSGYYYGDNKILGFSHTRLAGTGAQDGGHFLFMPTITPPNEIDFDNDYYLTFSHSQESAFPGYYSVNFDDEGILAEMTATERTGVHRYTFTKQSNRNLLINVTNALADKRAEEGYVKIFPERQEIVGSVRTFGSFAGRYGGIKVYFAALFDKPFSSYGIWDGSKFVDNLKNASSNSIIVNLGFGPKSHDQSINVKVGLSHVSVENARLNLESEVGNKSFDDIEMEAIEKWEEKLSLIKIKGSTEKDKIIFYSSLYRSFQMPTLFNDVNREYIGFDKNIHIASGFNYYTDLSLWDTFRTIHPLFNLIARDYQRDMLVSLTLMAKQGGHLPRWPSGNGYTGSMLGSPADITIAESYLKGITDFDVDYAYQSMKSNALNLNNKSNRRSIEGYLKYQYCPTDIKERSVGRTLEYAWADHSISLLAGVLGNKKDSIQFANHSEYYKNIWNHESQYFQGRNKDETFDPNFDPLQLTYTDWDDKYTKAYVEGSALQWRWAVPFDANGLIKLFKSREYFISELNDFFELSEPQLATWIPDSYYWHGNEPDIHAAYLFNYVDRPDLTQKWTRWILEHKYDNTYVGIDGNDDAGTLSAWYIFSSLGFYPIAGSDIYQIGSPLFKSVKVNLGEKLLKIEAVNYSTSNIYVKEIILNNISLNRRWIRHSEIAEGGELKFIMTDKPVNNIQVAKDPR